MNFSDEGVFKELINKRAFLDKVVLSINGLKKQDYGPRLRDVVNTPIGGPNRKYAWKVSGRLVQSANSFELLHGRMQLQRILPPLLFTIHSDGAPITRAMLRHALKALCEQVWKASISSLELTLDFNGIPPDFFRRNLFSPAHKFNSIVDEMGRETHYFGGPTSAMQAYAYQKTRAVTRLEFRLKRPFLRQHGITSIADLVKLRNIDLSRQLRVRELDAGTAEALVERVAAVDPGDIRRRILVMWLRDLPVREVVSASKKYFGGSNELMKVSLLEAHLHRMQRELVV